MSVLKPDRYETMRLRLAAATRDLVKACGGVERAGHLLNRSHSTIARWQGVDYDEVIPTLHAAILEADCGLPLVTSVMAELQGRALADRTVECGIADSVGAHTERVLSTAAHLMKEGAEALSDGRLTPAEAERMDRVAGDLERALPALRGCLAAAKCGGR